MGPPLPLATAEEEEAPEGLAAWFEVEPEAGVDALVGSCMSHRRGSFPLPTRAYCCSRSKQRGATVSFKRRAVRVPSGERRTVEEEGGEGRRDVPAPQLHPRPKSRTQPSSGT